MKDRIALRFLAALFVLSIWMLVLTVPERVLASTLPGDFVETQYGTGLTNPTAMELAPDGRIFVAEQGGALRVIKNGSTLATPFLTVTVDSNGERGLLGVTFDPEFTTNPDKKFVYIYYTVPGSPAHNRVSRFTANGDTAVGGSEVVLLELNNLSGAENHNGGAIHFGPDGKLYIAVGENANAANAQTLNNLLGKLLRLNADGSIPTDNPFYNTATGNNRAIWALGLRNPFTFSFQPGTGRMFINDVGQSAQEEINDGIAGANYGWNHCEGACSPTNAAYRDPLFQYPHSPPSTTSTGCAITGGAFYNPAQNDFPIDYTGDYFFADLCSSWIRRYDPVSDTASVFATGISQPVDLKVGPDGALYYLARGWGIVYRVTYSGSAPTYTPTGTATATATATRTLTPTVSRTATPTDTASPTPSPTLSPTITPTPSVTGTPTETQTPSLTPTVTETRTPTATPTDSPTPTPTRPKFVAHDDNLAIAYGGWRGIADANASGGSYRVSRAHYGESALSDAAWTFQGTVVTWYTVRGPAMGQARVLIDNADRGTFCLYRAEPEYGVAETFGGLAEGKHTIRVRVLGEACGGTDSNVAVDRFGTAAGTVESTAKGIVWGSWRGRANNAARGGVYRFSKLAGASVTVRVEGTTVRVMTLKGPPFGQMLVRVDGASAGILTLSNAAFAQAAQAFKNLGMGAHTVVLENASAGPPRGLAVDGFRGMTLVAATLDGP